MKQTTFFISRTKQIYLKTLTVSESTFKRKAISPGTHFEILLTSGVIYRQRFLHGDCATFSKLQLPRRYSRPFQNFLKASNKLQEKQLA